MAPTKMLTEHSYLTSIQTTRLSYIIWPQYTMQQTDRQRSEPEYQLAEPRLMPEEIFNESEFFIVSNLAAKKSPN